MRKTFEQQYLLGVKKIEDTKINKKCRDGFGKLCLALIEIYKNQEYRFQIFQILEKQIIQGKQQTGRPGMNLWQIFVFAQTRLSLNIDYDRLHHLANTDSMLRQILGVESEIGFEQKEFEYQNIADNVRLHNDESLKIINLVIIQMGHDV